MTSSNDPGFDENERELLRLASPPLPLDEQKLRATLQRAAQLPASRPHSRRRRHLFFGLGMCAAIVVAVPFLTRLGPGHGNPLPATLAEALSIAQHAETFPRERVQAAMHKIYLSAHRLLAVVDANPTLAQRTRAAVLEALASPVAPSGYEGGFEPLLARVERREPLTEADIAGITAAARASVLGLRGLGDAHALHVAEVRVLCNYLQQEATPDAAGTKGRTQKGTRQE